jgi:hypothetical protein
MIKMSKHDLHDVRIEPRGVHLLMKTITMNVLILGEGPL